VRHGIKKYLNFFILVSNYHRFWSNFRSYFTYFISHRGHRGPSAASGFALGRNQKIEGRLLQIRRMFFASAFLFTASAFGEGGEKRTTAKNKSRKFLFEKRLIRYCK